MAPLLAINTPHMGLLFILSLRQSPTVPSLGPGSSDPHKFHPTKVILKRLALPAGLYSYVSRLHLNVIFTLASPQISTFSIIITIIVTIIIKITGNF